MNPSSHKGRLFKRQQGRCCWCGLPMGALTASIEHIIPRSFGYKNGGTHCYDNKAAAHIACNTARSNDITREPHADRLFDFVHQRLLAARKFVVLPPEIEIVAKRKREPVNLRIPFSVIILRRVPLGWVAMASSARKNGRARVLRVTPPYRNRVVALADIEGAIR